VRQSSLVYVYKLGQALILKYVKRCVKICLDPNP
jgi:hypothetical protein